MLNLKGKPVFNALVEVWIHRSLNYSSHSRFLDEDRDWKEVSRVKSNGFSASLHLMLNKEYVISSQYKTKQMSTCEKNK